MHRPPWHVFCSLLCTCSVCLLSRGVERKRWMAIRVSCEEYQHVPYHPCLESFHRGPVYKAKTRHTQSRGPPLWYVLLGQNRGTLPPDRNHRCCCSGSTAERRRPGGIRGAPQDDPAGARRWNRWDPVGRKFPLIFMVRMLICSQHRQAPQNSQPPPPPLTALRPQISNARTMPGGSSGSSETSDVLLQLRHCHHSESSGRRRWEAARITTAPKSTLAVIGAGMDFDLCLATNRPSAFPSFCSAVNHSRPLVCVTARCV